jgi:hypothetical protein
MPFLNVDESEDNSSINSNDDRLSRDQDSFDSSNHNSGSGRNNKSDVNNSEMNEISDLAREDTRNIGKWRIIILVVLLGSLVFTTATMTIFLREEEEKSKAVQVRKRSLLSNNVLFAAQ